MKLAYTPIHPKNYLFSGIAFLSISVLFSQVIKQYDVMFYIFFAFVYSLLFFKVNFYDFISVEQHFLMVPTFLFKEKIDLNAYQYYQPISNHTLILRNETEMKVIPFHGIDQNFIIELETALESHGLRCWIE